MDRIRKDAPRPGRKPRISGANVDRIIDRTLHTKLPDSTHWSIQSLAEEMGVSNATIARIWKTDRMQPHRENRIKLSRDPEFN